MEALIVSFFAIAISEIGDKTQFVALCLATQFRRPALVLLGILAATLLSNAVAAGLGQWIGILLQGTLLHGLLALSFLGTAAWALIPEKTEDCPRPASRHGIFLACFTSFLLAEMGDKTQLATVALAARFHTVIWVVFGTTLGMMAANIPAVMLSHKLMEKTPLRLVHIASGVLFAVLGLYELTRLL